ncbi:MAG: OmpA family protein [Bacteroidota bacterium]|nr:OmpA family protein [Bacteroidota bacterium]MEC8599110.1 OmpA family protein [Bacteroidota bacterium]
MRYCILFIITLCVTNCVSTKVFNDLESRYSKVKIEKNKLQNSEDSLQQSLDKLDLKLSDTQAYLEISRDSTKLGLKINELLNEELDLVKKNSTLKIQENIAKNNALIKKIAIKETELLSRTERIDRLEKIISSQKKILSDLKNRISEALLNYRGKGLSIKQRNGKVYISMENKLLFKSGKWNIEFQGKQALMRLSKVLEENPDISILIEGHTDNIPFTSKGAMESNWDLSTKRATAVVKILLENNNILPQNLTAAGKSEFVPIASNTTIEGRAANRRIEIILSPSLDKIIELINSEKQ